MPGSSPCRNVPFMTTAANLSPIRPRLLATWALAHGLPRVALKAASRRGDAIAGTAADPPIRAGPFAPYDPIREQGVIVHRRVLNAPAPPALGHQIPRQDAVTVG